MSTTASASRALPWALIGAACLGSFAATSSGTTRAPFLLSMAHDLDVSMPLVANLVSMTSITWGIASAVGGVASDWIGRRVLLIAGTFFLSLMMVAQAYAGTFFWVALPYAIYIGFVTNGDHRNGYTVGAGVEYMFAPSWSAKVEYDYYNFGNATFSAPVALIPTGGQLSVVTSDGRIVFVGS